MKLYGLEENMLDFNGQVVPKSPGDLSSLIYKDALISILNADPIPGGYSPEDKKMAFDLAERISKSNGEAFEIEIGEIALIKQRAGLVASPLAFGRVSGLLDHVNQKDRGDG